MENQRGRVSVFFEIGAAKSQVSSKHDEDTILKFDRRCGTRCDEEKIDRYEHFGQILFITIKEKI